MKPVVVFYHTTAPKVAHGLTEGDYIRVCERFVEMCKAHNLEVIHCTCSPAEIYTDKHWVVFDLDLANIVYNREVCFLDFLTHCADKGQEYIFLEPDINIVRMWPELPVNYDLSLLYRCDATPHISPSWRLCTRVALPIFEEIVSYMSVHDRKDWHGDSEAFNALYANIVAQHAYHNYRGVRIQWRVFEEYVKPWNTYIEHFVAAKKRDLLKKEI